MYLLPKCNGVVMPSEKGFRQSRFEHAKNDASAYSFLAVLICGVLVPSDEGF
jgi:hypothetical protein